MKKAATDQLAPVYKRLLPTVNSQQIKQSTDQDARVYRCKKSMKMQKESEQQSTAKMMKMPHSMKMKQSTAKMPQDQQSRSTNRSNGSTMEVYAPTDKMKKVPT